MSRIKGVEPLYLLPDRFEAATFSSQEAELVLGEDADQELSKDNFNWLGAYLVEQVGLHESEVTERFTSGARGLRGQQPLDVWSTWDGFEKVFNYAKTYKASVDEDLGDQSGESDDPLIRSHSIANSALNIILKGFQAAEIDLIPDGRRGMNSHTIWNPKRATPLFARWKGDGYMEDYRITRTEGDRTSMYYIVRALPGDEPPMVLQSGIVESFRGEYQQTSSDSDINGRAPSAGEVATFVIPLANEVRNQTLSLMTR